MTGFLIILALLGAFIGAVFLSNATMGVGFIGGACLLGILARIAQASIQHQELIQKIKSKNINIEELNKEKENS